MNERLFVAIFTAGGAFLVWYCLKWLSVALPIGYFIAFAIIFVVALLAVARWMDRRGLG